MANGYSLSAVSGKREIMELGSIEKKELREFFYCLVHMVEKCQVWQHLYQH